VIRLTRLNGTELFLNADLVATVEARPDTVVTLVDGKHFVVADSTDDVVMRVTRYRAAVLALAEQMSTTSITPATLEPGPSDTDRKDKTDRPAGGKSGNRGLYVLHGDSAGD
jgi:flagellar protein FlbD